jgi:hypothetical protein
MGDQKEEQQHKHPQEQLLEAVVVNCQHIAAICKGLCVRGVSHDVSVKELERHKELNDSDSLRILKDECLRCQTILSECVVNLDKLKRQYLSEYNRNDSDNDSKLESETKPETKPELEIKNDEPDQVLCETPISTPESKVPLKKGKKSAVA